MGYINFLFKRWICYVLLFICNCDFFVVFGALDSFLCTLCSYSGCFTQWFGFYIGGKVCVLLIGLNFLQCSEYCVMCISICVIHV